MGYYIETAQPTEKAKQLFDLYQEAELVLSPESFDFTSDFALICVVENGLWDAAGIAYNADERDAFNNPNDTREKTWLKIPKSLAINLCPYVADRFDKPDHPFIQPI
jgi:hypothetical protein